MRLPDPCLVVLVGAPGSGKSTWARTWFGDDRVVSSDALRGVVGRGANDQRASGDAFAVLDAIVAARLRRGLTTVVDSTALEPERRNAYRSMAAASGVPCIAVVVDTEPALCKKRNKARPVDRRLPEARLATMLERFSGVVASLPTEGFDRVHVAGDDAVALVPADLVDVTPAPGATLAFGLSIGRFGGSDGNDGAGLADRLADVARAGEAVGLRSLWLMDHLRQIPQVGRAWDDLPDPWPTLGFLASVTERATLGTLVSPVTLRHPVLLARSVAALDALSGGRAALGLGLGWFAAEHAAAGLPFPSVAERYELLEDALEALPLLLGPGATPYEGRRTTIPDTSAYPRPLQEQVPVLVGGSGPRKTLRLVAKHAHACNLRGSPDEVRASLAALYAHCEDLGRDPATIRVTHLSEVAVATAHRRPGPHAGTVDELVARYGALAEAGVDEAILSIPGPLDPGEVLALADVVRALR